MHSPDRYGSYSDLFIPRVRRSLTVRHVTFLVRRPDEYLNSVEQRLIDHPDVVPTTVNYAELLADDTLAMLGRVTGDVEKYRQILRDAEDILEFAVSSDGDEAVGYSRLIPTDFTRSLFAAQQASDFVVRMPVEYTDDGRQRYTVVGTAAAFSGERFQFPDDVTVSIESVTNHHPVADSLRAELTTREREVLATAVDVGYYQNPREATHEDLATELGISASAVGKHLRSIEAKVFGDD